jgi:hypothetical protein
MHFDKALSFLRTFTDEEDLGVFSLGKFTLGCFSYRFF